MKNNNDVTRLKNTENIFTDTIPELFKELVDKLHRLSEAYYYQGQLAIAVQLYESNAYLLTSGDLSTEDKARFQSQHGKTLYYQNSLADTSFESAWSVLRNAQEFAKASSDKACLAKVIDLIGLVFYTQAFSNGDFEEPRKYFQEAFELRQQLGDTQGMSETLFHLGLTYQNKDNRNEEDRNEALNYFHQALRLAQTGNHQLEESYVVRHIAAEYQEDGDLIKALAGFERSLALREQIGYKVYQPAAHMALGQLHRVRGDVDQAIKSYQQAHELAAQMKQFVSVVRAQLAMGDIEKENRNLDRALQHYKTAFQVAETNHYKNGMVTAKAKIDATEQEL